jgi:hypothetical protein
VKLTPANTGLPSCNLAKSRTVNNVIGGGLERGRPAREFGMVSRLRADEPSALLIFAAS